MKICQIGVIEYNFRPSVPEKKAIGGIQSYTVDLIKYLLKKKHNIVFVGKIFSSRLEMDLKYYEVKKRISSTNSFLISLLLKSFSVKLTKDFIIHAHRPDHFLAFSWFRRNRGILTLHGQQSIVIRRRKNYFVQTIFGFLEFFALKKATKIIATDNVTKNFYQKKYPWINSKLNVVPTGVNLEHFRKIGKLRARKQLGLQKNDKVIIYIGRIEPPKRILDIVRSFVNTRQYFEELKLLIIGDGQNRSKIERFIMDHNLSEDVFLVGAIEHFELPKWINAADISVLYSDYEGSPIAVKESLACGVPVVANNVGDISEVIINGKNGYVFNEKNIVTLTKFLKKGLENSEQLKKFCIPSIKNYSSNEINKKIEFIYKQI